ncbi:MAG: hypothetical protein GXP49_07045 [Deltaproteobacteria bacterium]|nr:hypothetical protein [Deltaproteobacteria bacterium]
MRTFRLLVWLIVCIYGAGTTAADKESLEKKDESQASYKRKSITYLGIFGKADKRYLNRIERFLRPQLEMKRFDYNHVNLSGSFTIADFVQAIRNYVEQKKLDRAKAEGEFSERFKEINVTLSDVERIANSAYFYQIRVPRLNFQKSTLSETWRFCLSPNAGAVTLGMAAKLGKKQSCPSPMVEVYVPVTREFWKVDLKVDADFFHVELKKQGKGYTKIATASTFRENDAERPVRVLVTINKGRVKQRSYEYTEPAESTKARAFNGINFLFLAKELQKQERSIPAFKLKAAVQSSSFNGVFFPLGKREGLWKDIGFYVMEFDTTGKKHEVGYVKVRDIGDNKKKPPENSWAQTIYSRNDWSFEGGELLMEYPQVGYNVILAAGVASLYVDDSNVSAKNAMFGAGTFGMGLALHLVGEWDLAEYLHISEFYQTLHLEGDIYSDMYAGFIGLGFLWKYYIHRLALGFEVYGMYGRLGGSYDSNGDGTKDIDVSFDDDNNHCGGVAGQLVIEIFITPDFSLIFRGGARLVGSTAPGIPAYALSGPTAHAGISYTF